MIGFIWSIGASFVTIVYPVWESREGKQIMRYYTSQRSLTSLIYTLLHRLHAYCVGIVKIFNGITGDMSGTPPPKAYDSVVEVKAVTDDDNKIAKGDSV